MHGMTLLVKFQDLQAECFGSGICDFDYVSAGNVVQTLVMSSVVPMTIFAFTLSLPYLPPAPPLGPNFWIGTAVLVAGLFTFNSPQWRPVLQKKMQGKAA